MMVYLSLPDKMSAAREQMEQQEKILVEAHLLQGDSEDFRRPIE